jgi:hypothetical protein
MFKMRFDVLWFNTLFRKPFGMAFLRNQAFLKSSEIPELRNNQESDFNEKL